MPDTRQRPAHAASVPSRDGEATESIADYDGFVSYSHAVDGRLAPALQAGLHRFAKPWYRVRALRIFRDETSLSATPELWPSIVAALDRSRWLILLASPEAAKSTWVNDEVAHWCAKEANRKRIMVVVTKDDHEGEFDWDATTAVPPTLRRALSTEPRVVDLRWARAEADISLQNARFRDAVADAAAPLHGRPKDELHGEDVRQHRRAKRLARAAVAALAALALGAATAAFLAVQAANEAERQRDQAVSRELAARSLDSLESDSIDALDLATRAVTTAETPESIAALRAAIAAPYPRLVVKLTRSEDVAEPLETLTAATFTPDGQALIALTGGAAAMVVDRDSGRVLRRLSRDGGSGGNPQLEFDRQGRRILYDHGTGLLLAEWRERGQVVSIGDNESWNDVGSPEGGALSADGQRVLLMRAGEQATEYDAGTGRRLASLRSSFASYGPRRLILYGPTTESGRDASIWRISADYKTEARVAVLRGAGDLIAAGISGDGQTVATVDRQNRATMWSATTGRRIARLPWRDAEDVAFSPEGDRLLVTRAKGTANIWEVRPARPVAELSATTEAGASEQVWSVARFSPDGILVGTIAGSEARIWNARTGERVADLRGHSGRVLDVRFSPDGTEIVTASDDGTIRVWENATGEASIVRSAHTGGVTAVAVADRGRLVASGGQDGTVKIWAAQTLDERWSERLTAPAERLVFADGGKLVASSHGASTALWSDVSRGANPRILNGRLGGFSPDGRLLVTAGFDERVAWLYSTSGADPAAPVRLLRGHNGGVNHAEFSPTGRVIATASQDDSARLWDASSGAEIDRISFRTEVGSASVNDIAFDTRGEKLLIESDLGNGAAFIWNPETDTKVQSRAAEIGVSAFDPTGTRVASATLGGETVVWDAHTGRVLTRLGGQAQPAFSFTFTRDGRYVVTGGTDGIARLWDVSSGRRLGEFRGHQGAIQAVAFSSDGLRFMTGGADGTLRLYECSTCGSITAWVNEARRRVAGARIVDGMRT